MDRMRLQSNQHIPSRMGGMHRCYRRGDVSGFSCDIADGHRSFGGIVDDVSCNGFKMSQVKDTFLADEHTYRAVVSGNGKHYQMLAKPCWRRKTEAGLEIGFKIVDVSWEWTEFVLETVPEKNQQSRVEGNT